MPYVKIHRTQIKVEQKKKPKRFLSYQMLDEPCKTKDFNQSVNKIRSDK